MDNVIVLAMHGAPPKDFPGDEMEEYFSLHHRLGRAGPRAPAAWRDREQELETRMRRWPRTAANDPFWAASEDLARHLADATGAAVFVGFNEFCGPDVEEAIDEAARRRPAQVVVVTPMLTRGGEHAEADIPAAIERARAKHPAVSIVYAWPFEPAEVARFLAARISQVGTVSP